MMDNELGKLIEHYEHLQVESKKKTVELVKRIEYLENENKQLSKNHKNEIGQEKIDYAFFVDTIDKLIVGSVYQLAEEWTESPTQVKSYLLMVICEKLIENKKIEILIYLLNLIVRNSSILTLNYDRTDEKFMALAEHILLEEISDNYQLNEQAVLGVLDIFSKLKGTEISKTRLLLFLKMEHTAVFDYIVLTQNKTLIKKYLKVLLMFDLMHELKSSLITIIDSQWYKLESRLNDKDFAFLLWYSYLFGFDEDLIDYSKISLKSFNKEIIELNLYFYLNDAIRINKEILALKIEEFRKTSIFNSNEKKLVIEKIKKSLTDKPNNETAAALEPKQKPEKAVVKRRPYNNKLYVIDEKNVNHFINKYKLKRTNVYLPLYKGLRDSIATGYTDKMAFASPDNSKVFLTRKEVKQIMNENGNLTPKVREYTDSVSRDEKKKKKEIKNAFEWPVTEIYQQKHDRQDSILNDKSALMVMGYKITGLTRQKRWEILQRAVPKLGLKKVAYTIASHIKLRKGQKNGRNKFSYSISEWEYDLSKLKSVYYKKDFNWPQT